MPWYKTARLEWTNTFYPTFKIRKREGSRYTLKHYRLTEGETLLANFRNLPDAKRYAEDIIRQNDPRIPKPTIHLDDENTPAPDSAMATTG